MDVGAQRIHSKINLFPTHAEDGSDRTRVEVGWQQHTVCKCMQTRALHKLADMAYRAYDVHTADAPARGPWPQCCTVMQIPHTTVKMVAALHALHKDKQALPWAPCQHTQNAAILIDRRCQGPRLHGHLLPIKLNNSRCSYAREEVHNLSQCTAALHEQMLKRRQTGLRSGHALGGQGAREGNAARAVLTTPSTSGICTGR